MIQVNLGRLLGERKMKVAELSRRTGVSQHALLKLYHEKLNMVRFDTLERICKVLSCQVSDLLEYKPQEQM
ncbi:MAG TPA: helix-turn-helix transcriptional regulator [Methylomirabilota bacterium]|nr:helix-turn-helix transcriptional regulator [Methylomirabilota bacterium]